MMEVTCGVCVLWAVIFGLFVLLGAWRQRALKAEAIVAKLPKTADGVPVLPNDRVWYARRQEDATQVRVTAITVNDWFKVGPHLVDDVMDIPECSDGDEAPLFYSSRSRIRSRGR